MKFSFKSKQYRGHEDEKLTYIYNKHKSLPKSFIISCKRLANKKENRIQKTTHKTVHNPSATNVNVS